MIFDKRLKVLKVENDKSTKEIADFLGIHNTLYSRYEKELQTLPLKHVIALSNYYNVSIDFMFGLTKIKQYKNSRGKIDLKNVGKRLKVFRIVNDLTQTQLALFLNCSQSNIVSYEKGTCLISTDYLYAIAKKYGISADYLLGRIGEPVYWS